MVRANQHQNQNPNVHTLLEVRLFSDIQYLNVNFKKGF